MAWSSGSRRIGTFGGNAESSRDGIAADKTTNIPRSPSRRIRRPKACASRARTTRSS